MKLKVIEQENYEDYILLTLDKELPVGWFDKKMIMEGKEIYFTRGIFPDYIKISGNGDYVGKVFEIDDKSIKKPYREK